MKNIPGGLMARLVGHAQGYALHLTPDHVLCRGNTGLTYQHRRLFLVDIEQITLQRTRRALLITAVLASLALGVLVLTYAVLALTESLNGPGGIFLNPVTLLITAPLCGGAILNVLMGATCRTIIRTRAHSEHVKSLSRERIALRALKMLEPAIREAQRGLAVERAVPDTEQEDDALPGPE
ncbi:MAG: hypothetical protein HYV27_09700 [Candidatus Hydrogenedentes bacterium]|nr:hypothetical protein [Candidatus Hydrogenedentota bacterium]